MRDLKFRAWNGSKMFSFDGIFNQALREHGNAMKVMQATGLKDKAGVEIYEGDILLHDGESFATAEGLLVMWSEYGFVFTDDDVKESCWELNQLDPERCEVAGNIYETPSCRLSLLNHGATNRTVDGIVDEKGSSSLGESFSGQNKKP